MAVMSTRSITCPTCSHGFAVPADARTAICPKCGRALPILAARLSFTGDELPRPRKAEEPAPAKPQLAPRLARIPLKRRETRFDDSVDTANPTDAPGTLTTPTTERPAPIVEKPSRSPRQARSKPPPSRPPPPPPPLPPEARRAAGGASYDVAILPAQEESRVYAVDGDGRTGVDLPHRPHGSGLDPSLPPSEETERGELPHTQLQAWQSQAQEDPGEEIGDGDIFEVESGELPAQPAAEHIIEDDWPTGAAHEVGEPLTSAAAASPAPLPPLIAGAALRGEAVDGPDDPTIPKQSQSRTPVPDAVMRKLPKSFHRDLTASARVRALSSVIEDDELTGSQGLPGTESGLDLPPLKPPSPRREPDPEPEPEPAPVPVRPTPSSLAPLPDQGVDDADAPMNLPDTGIVVLLPQSPIQELGLSKPSKSVEIHLPIPTPPPPVAVKSAELAPITRRPRAAGAARGQGVALKEGASSGVELPRGLIVIAGGVVLLIIALTLFFILRR